MEQNYHDTYVYPDEIFNVESLPVRISYFWTLDIHVYSYWCQLYSSYLNTSYKEDYDVNFKL